MKFSFDSIACIVIGIFGIVAGYLNKGFYLSLWTRWHSNKKTQRIWSFILGGLFLLLALGLMRLEAVNNISPLDVPKKITNQPYTVIFDTATGRRDTISAFIYTQP